MPLRLVMTCGACPEQYDVFDGDEEVGYLRLRHGSFRAECRGEVVYTARPRGDGIFDDDERDYYLRFAVDAIERALGKEPSVRTVPPNLPPAPDVEYEVST